MRAKASILLRSSESNLNENRGYICIVGQLFSTKLKRSGGSTSIGGRQGPVLAVCYHQGASAGPILELAKGEVPVSELFPFDVYQDCRTYCRTSAETRRVSLKHTKAFRTRNLLTLSIAEPRGKSTR